MTGKRTLRLRKARRRWLALQTYVDDETMIQAYQKAFHVNSVCATKDLCMLNALSEAKLAEHRAQLEKKKAERRALRQELEWELSLPESDETFAYIAGYTPGGVPYGITWEEQAKIDAQDRMNEKLKEQDSPFDDDFELPF